MEHIQWSTSLSSSGLAQPSDLSLLVPLRSSRTGLSGSARQPQSLRACCSLCRECSPAHPALLLLPGLSAQKPPPGQVLPSLIIWYKTAPSGCQFLAPSLHSIPATLPYHVFTLCYHLFCSLHANLGRQELLSVS